MNRLRHSSAFVVAVSFLVASSSMLFVSCRTSRQESRRPVAPASVQSTGIQTALGHQVDSLLIIEEKLLEVIDSMTGLVNADHSRILELEREVHEMSAARNAAIVRDAARAYTPPLPPAASPYDNSQSGQDTPPVPSAPPPSVMPPPVTAPPTSAPPAASTPMPESSAMQARYSTALRTFNDNNFETALTQFQSLEQDDPNGAYASNYIYWEGECYYAEKRYNMALQNFGNVLSQYPSSTKAAAAQFKTAECYEKLNIPSSARQAYERVIADYPTSEYKARAQARLKALNN